MEIAIIGAGAMGSRFGWQLAKSGNAVTLVDDWDKNIEAVKENGVIAEHDGKKEGIRIPIYPSKEFAKLNSNFDLLVVFTKAMGLERMLETVQPAISKSTYVLCLLNGLGHEDTLSKYVDHNHIIMGVTMIASQMTAPGNIKFEGNGNIEMQSLSDIKDDQEAVRSIIDTFNQANLNAEYSNNVLYSIWRKACVNSVMNTMGALLETNNIGFGNTKVAGDVTEEILFEFEAVAKHEGVILDHDEVFNHIKETWSVPHYASMYQDLVKNKRLTEVDFINGAVCRKGESYGVATPYCKLVTQLIHAKEDINHQQEE